MAPALLPNYASEFDPDRTLADFSRPFLAVLGREYLLCGHLIDRIGLPLIMSNLDRAALVRFSIDEWMGASPIYSMRMQKALDFVGTDVGTMFKNLQLDIGAPPQFMDFQMRLDSPEYGEFWLDHCGALMDLEPWGDEMVTMMCHDIEDPTFDATAATTNPRMKVRPIHRPPRQPADRSPHCHWKVFIDEEAQEYEQHPNFPIVARSLIADIPLDLPDTPPPGGEGGRDSYSGEFDPDFQLEDLSHRALLVVAQEAAVQAHLLVRAYLLAVTERVGASEAKELGDSQWTGSAAMAAERIKKASGIDGDGIDAVAKVFQLHPHFYPRTYVDLRVEITGPLSARLTIGRCPALDEADDLSWFHDLGTDPHPALDAIARAVNPRASLHPTTTHSDSAVLAWDIVIDPTAEPFAEPKEMGTLRMSSGVTFVMNPRRR